MREHPHGDARARREGDVPALPLAHRPRVEQGRGAGLRVRVGETTWGAYLKTYQGKQLHGGGAYPMFRSFIDRWPEARTPRDKLLAIDALIHACHGQFRGGMGRPAACNLIEGAALDLVRFLNELAYGSESTQGVADTRQQWNTDLAASPWLRRGVEANDDSGAPHE